MKLSEYKKLITIRFDLLKANLWFTFQQEITYVGNNWAGLASTTFYTISMLLFLKIIYSNVKVFAGYSYQEMLFFFLMAQFTFYLNWTFTQRNIYDFINDVNNGNLDIVLTKPVPALFYLFTRSINLFSLVKEGLPPTLAVTIFINWHALNFSPLFLLIGLTIFLLGLWILHVLAFISALPVFWLGESTSIVDLTLQMGAGNGTLIPYEGYNNSLKFLLGVIMPVLITTQFSTSAMLNKSNPYFLLIWAFVIAVIFTILRKILWKIAIKNYTSASS